MMQTMITQSRAPVRVLAGPSYYTSILYMGFVKMFNVLLDLSTIYFAHFSMLDMARFQLECAPAPK